MQRFSRQDPPAGIRPETLTPFVGWVPPDSDELLRIKGLMEDALGAQLSGSDMSRMGGVRDSRTWRDWVAGTKKIPYSVWGIYCEWAGFGCIWRDEKVDLASMDV